MNLSSKQYWTIVTILSCVFLAMCAISLWVLFSDYDIILRPKKTGDLENKNLEASTSTPFLTEEEIVIDEAGTTTKEILPVEKTLFQYVEVTDGCGHHFEGTCVRVRSGPGLDYPVVGQLRNNMVLKIDGKVEHDGHTWYKVVFDEWLRYPERVTGDWYVAADYVEVLFDEGARALEDGTGASSTKQIVVDRSEQTLSAYDGDKLFMTATISTGLELTPTPRGTFTIYKKTPSRYMQGPTPYAPGQYYDLPGVPWNLYFTQEGAVLHGAYWHDNFGTPYSHGCVNLSPQDAHQLYTWADLGTQVIVKD